MDSSLFPPLGLRRSLPDKPGLPRIPSNPSAAAVVLELAAFVAKLQIQAAQNASQMASEAPKRSSHSRRSSVTFAFDSHSDHAAEGGGGAHGEGGGAGGDVTSPGLTQTSTQRSSTVPPSSLPPRHPSTGGSRRGSMASVGSVESHGEGGSTGTGGPAAALIGSPTTPAPPPPDLSALRVSITVEEVQLLAHLVDSLQPLLVGGSIRLPSIEEGAAVEGHSGEGDSSTGSSPADRAPALLRTPSGHSLVDTVREQLSKGGSALAGMGAILTAAHALQHAQGGQGAGETPLLDVSTPGTVYSPAVLAPPRGNSFSLPNPGSAGSGGGGAGVPSLAIPSLERLAIGRGDGNTGHTGIEIGQWTSYPPAIPPGLLASPSTMRSVTGIDAPKGEGGAGGMPSGRPRLMSSLSSDGNMPGASLRRAATAFPSPARILGMPMSGGDGGPATSRAGRGAGGLYHHTSLADMSLGGGAPLTSRASKRRNSRLRIDDELAKSFAAHPSIFNDESIRDYVTSLVSTAEDEARKAKAAKLAALKVGSGQLGLAAAADTKFKRAGISVTQAVAAVSGMGGLASVIDAFKAGGKGSGGAEGSAVAGDGEEGGGRPSVGEELGSLVNAHVSEAGSTGGSDEGHRQGTEGEGTTAHTQKPPSGSGASALLSLLPYPLSAASPTASSRRRVSSTDSLTDRDMALVPQEEQAQAQTGVGIAVRPPPVPPVLPAPLRPPALPSILHVGVSEEQEGHGQQAGEGAEVLAVLAAAPPPVPPAFSSNRTVALFAKKMATRRGSQSGAQGSIDLGGSAQVLKEQPQAQAQAEGTKATTARSPSPLPAKPTVPAVSPAKVGSIASLVEHQPVPLPPPAVRAHLLQDLGHWSFDLLAVNKALVQGEGGVQASSSTGSLCLSPVGSPSKGAGEGSDILARSPASPLGTTIVPMPEDLQAASVMLYRRVPFPSSSAGVGIEALVSIAVHACSTSGVARELGLQTDTMQRYFTALGKAYDSTLSYHNALHAADVLQAVFYCITKGGMSPGGEPGVHESAPPAAKLTAQQTCAMLLAAVAHDAGHPGLNNPFLVSSSHELAITYNDRSPLENMHAATAFLLMKQPGCDLLGPLETEQRAAVRASVVDLILATDNGQHFRMVKKLQGRVSRWARAQAAAQRSRARWSASIQADSEGPMADRVDEEEPPLATSEDDEDDDDEEEGGQQGAAGEGEGSQAGTPRGEDAELAMLSPTAAAAVTAARLNMSRKNDEKLLLHAVLHGCDIANPARPWRTAAAWASAVTAEFHAQGDAMRGLGMPVPPMFDAHNAGQARKRAANQIGFIMALVLPLWSTLAEEPYASILGAGTAKCIVEAIQGNLSTLGAITQAGVEANLLLDEEDKAESNPQ